MACFLVPLSVAIVISILKKIGVISNEFAEKWKINWLLLMIYGAALMLAVEHIAHQEIVPWPPFLTAMATPEDTAVMLEEMAAVGVPMLIATVAVWIVLVVVSNYMTAKSKKYVKA